MTEEWRNKYPTVVVTRTFKGDEEFAKKYYTGEANKLHYQMKNLMGELGQFKMTRVLTDGTVITAKSVSGHDFIHVDTSKPTGVRGVRSCVITFINLPDKVPPMANPGTVLPSEVEGVDYVKTYYIANVSECGDCSGTEWELTLQDSLLEIYSIDPPAWAEIIEQGSDNGGTYIIWKAYTEASNMVRTGLAYILLKSYIKDSGEELCSAEQEITVDCCEKPSDQREVGVWWEKEGDGDPIDLDGTTLYPIEDSPEIDDLDTYDLYTAAEVKGACLPYDWTLDGRGELTELDEYGLVVAYTKPDDEICCDEEVKITLTTGCEGSKEVVAKNCCDTAEELSLSATSYQIGPLDSVTLTVEGGCCPFIWQENNGVGTLVINPDNQREATYTAPSSVADCPTASITVTDCCSEQDNVEILLSNPAVAASIAGHRGIWTYVDSCTSQEGSGPVVTFDIYLVQRYDIYCDGAEVFISQSYLAILGDPPAPGGDYCLMGFEGECWPYPGEPAYMPSCSPASDLIGFYTAAHLVEDTFYGDGYLDTRSASLIANGCCPPQFA